MIRIKTLTALAAGAVAVSAAGVAMAQTPYGTSPQYDPYRAPSGSFTSSCRDVQSLENGYISAQCRTEGGFRWSTIRASDCRGDITNRDGVLTCYGATARTGPFYADDGRDPAYGGGYGSTSGSGYPVQNGPGGVLGTILGAVFGNNYGQSPALEDDWNRGGRPMAQQGVALQARIDAGVRDGTLDRGEAVRLRADYDALVRLEDRYAADGRLTPQERDELRRRYDALSRQVSDERYGQPGYGDDIRYPGEENWQSVRERESVFSARVDAAVRARTLDRNSAGRLQREYADLMRQEDSFRRDGLSRDEQAMLERDYQALIRRVPGDDYRYPDDNTGNGRSMAERHDEFDARVNAGLRAGTISRAEATRLRADFQSLERLETTYQRGGLTSRERTDLDSRWSRIDARLGARVDGGYGGNYGNDGYGSGYGNDGYGSSSDPARIEARIVAGERGGRLSVGEAARLRTELGDLVRLEAAYARDGLDANERAYVSRRYTELDGRVSASQR